MLAPTRVIHVLSAYVQHSTAEGRDSASVADDLLSTDIRQLLGKAIPDPHPRLFQLLDRLATPAQALEVYERINRLLHGPAGKILLDSPTISVCQLALAEGIAADPVLVAARKAIGGSHYNFKLLVSTLAFLRTSGLARSIEALPDASGWPAICRRIKADLGRAQAPNPPFRIPDGWRHVTDIATLWHVGRELGNCVSSLSTGGNDHIRDLIAGTTAIENVGVRLWKLGDVGPLAHPQEGRDKLIKGLTVSMTAINGTLLDEEPLQAMHIISWRTERTNASNDDLDWVA
jgi:hypothetical protein